MKLTIDEEILSKCTDEELLKTFKENLEASRKKYNEKEAKLKAEEEQLAAKEKKIDKLCQDMAYICAEYLVLKGFITEEQVTDKLINTLHKAFKDADKYTSSYKYSTKLFSSLF